MSDYRMALESYRAEIADLEARARAVRDAWFSADYEANEQEADQLDETVQGLRRSLVQIMRERFIGALDQNGDEEAPSEHRDLWFE